MMYSFAWTRLLSQRVFPNETRSLVNGHPRGSVVKFMDCPLSCRQLLSVITIENIYIIYIKYVTIELYPLGYLLYL